MRLCSNACALIACLAALGSSALAAPDAAGVPAPVTVSAVFAAPGQPGRAPAITYDPAGVPAGARATVTETANKWGGMSVALGLAGARPRQTYRAYVHIDPCTADPAGAGARLQNGPSHASYEANEVWIDLGTDAAGNGTAVTNKYWGIAADQRANSVVIHLGDAAAPAACVTVPFRRLTN